MTYQGGGQFAQYVQANPDVAAEFNRVGGQFGGDMNAFGQFHYNTYGQGEGRQLPGAVTTPGVAPQTSQPNAMSQFGGYSPAGYGDITGNFRGASMAPYADAGMPYGLGDGFISTGTMDGGMINATGNTMGQMPTQTGQTATQAQNAAFDNFRNSTGYQFRLGEGLDAVGSTYAGIGGLQSGAAMRGITDYGQNFASNEFGNYINALGSQQAVGAQSASALTGVGQNFAGTVIGSNNQNAQNQMNAQLGRQNAFANGLGNFGGVLQNLAGTVLGAAVGGGAGR
jgi:hypothetical protein